MFKRKGQNIAEYAILIALIIAAAVAMQTYVKRGLQGRVRDVVDHAPDTYLVAGKAIQFKNKQYEPYYLDASSTVQSDRDYKDVLSQRGKIDRTGVVESATKASGSYEEMIYKGTGTQ